MRLSQKECVNAKLHDVQEAGVRQGTTLLVTGTGGLGLASLQLAKALEVTLLGFVTRREEGFYIGTHFGANEMLSMKEGHRAISWKVRREGGVRSFVVVLDTIGTEESFQLALDSVRPG